MKNKKLTLIASIMLVAAILCGSVSAAAVDYSNYTTAPTMGPTTTPSKWEPTLCYLFPSYSVLSGRATTTLGPYPPQPASMGTGFTVADTSAYWH